MTKGKQWKDTITPTYNLQGPRQSIGEAIEPQNKQTQNKGCNETLSLANGPVVQRDATYQGFNPGRNFRVHARTHVGTSKHKKSSLPLSGQLRISPMHTHATKWSQDYTLVT